MARVGKKAKAKFKICKELIILIVVLVGMIVTTICLSIPSQATTTYEELNGAISNYNSANSTSYGTLGEDHVYKISSFNDVTGAISSSKSGTAEDAKYVYVLYGSLSNATVLEFLSIINTEAQNREVSTVYYYSSSFVDDQVDKDDSEFVATLESNEQKLNATVTPGVDEIDLLVTPAFYVYKNGSLIFNSNTMDEESTYNWYLMVQHAFKLK